MMMMMIMMMTMTMIMLMALKLLKLKSLESKEIFQDHSKWTERKETVLRKQAGHILFYCKRNFMRIWLCCKDLSEHNKSMYATC